MNNLGIHAYDQIKPLDYETELLLFNLMSILSWNKYMGSMDLYCNTDYLDNLKKYKIDSLYNKIDTKILDRKPKYIDYNQYWAFCKLLVMEKLKSSFTMVDTDLYIKRTLEFDKDYVATFYHKETFNTDYIRNVYIDFNQLIPQDIKDLHLDPNVLPTNTAILHIEDPTFINLWVKMAKEIAIFNANIKVDNPSSKICFVEQRLLPMILEKRKRKYTTLLKSIYQSHLSDSQDGNEWLPSSSILSIIDPEEANKFFSIKHLWGIKSLFKDENIRNLIMNMVIDDFEEYSEHLNYFSEIYEKVLKKYKREFTN
jgi:hypothetical protein